MPLESKPSSAAALALIYVTLGALLAVWSGIWFWFLQVEAADHGTSPYWSAGFLLSGVALMVIGLAWGRIERSARQAELPPEEVTPAAARAEQDAAARAPLAAGANGTGPLPTSQPAPGGTGNRS